MKIQVALVDDHILLRNGLASLINSINGYEVIFEAENGIIFREKINPDKLPSIVLMDINMPVMDGYESTQWLKAYFPEIKVLALSMYDNEQSIIRMLKCGARGYILKDIDPSEFRVALESLRTKGYYYSDLVTGRLIHAVNNSEKRGEEVSKMPTLSSRERDFLILTCSELTYKEIADKMSLSPRTVDGYRDSLFEKLEVRTRVGLVMYCIKNGIVIL